MSKALNVPDNITLLPLPPRSPELNPVENIWQYPRENWLSNRIFRGYEDILALCCDAWNRLTNRPWKIMSIGLRDWAHGFRSAQVSITRKREYVLLSLAADLRITQVVDDEKGMHMTIEKRWLTPA
jgi:putative transposase